MGHLDGYLWMFALVIALAATTFYFGFIYPSPQPDSPGYPFWAYIRGKNKGGFLFVAAVLVPLASIVLSQAARVDSRVAELLDPYPSVSETIVVPDVDSDPDSYQLIVTTADPPRAVLDFYSAPDHRLDWEVVERDDSMIHLVRDDQRLLIVATADASITTIGYLVSGR